MDQSKALSKGDVPFSLEKKPGVSKLINEDNLYLYNQQQQEFMLKLPPPPCPMENPRVSLSTNDDLIKNIPLPPCTFQPPPPRSSSKRGLKKQDDDDPFLVAYKKCTRSTKKGSNNHKLLSRNEAAVGSGFLKGYNMFKFSCKNSCTVRDDNIVRVSHLPCEIDRESRV